MARKILYHTVADNDNPDYVLSNAPFKCEREPWLGKGYYFWDSYIEHAHWWGKVGYHGKYMITQVECDYHPEEVFNLVGDTDNLKTIAEAATLVKADLKLKEQPLLINIINFLRTKTSFAYKAIRVEGRGSFSYKVNPELTKQIRFSMKLPAYLDMSPQIQICYFSKKDIHIQSFAIVHPEYMDNYGV